MFKIIYNHKKESYFLSLAPEQRLEMHEELRKKIWGKNDNNFLSKPMKLLSTPP